MTQRRTRHRRRETAITGTDHGYARAVPTQDVFLTGVPASDATTSLPESTFVKSAVRSSVKSTVAAGVDQDSFVQNGFSEEENASADASRGRRGSARGGASRGSAQRGRSQRDGKRDWSDLRQAADTTRTSANTLASLIEQDAPLQNHSGLVLMYGPFQAEMHSTAGVGVASWIRECVRKHGLPSLVRYDYRHRAQIYRRDQFQTWLEPLMA
jgi:hypothetical protein